MKDVAELVVKARSIVGEGAYWDADANVLFWVDIMNSQVFVYDPAKDENRSYGVGEHVGTVVPRRGGGAVVALKNSVATLDLETGTVEKKAYPAKEEPGNRFNDGKCDPSGRLWAGTMAYDEKEGAGNVYRIGADFSTQKVIENVTISNGLAWSFDKKTMYYIDTPTSRVDAFDYDDETGNISNRRTAIEVEKSLGYPDGMTIDEEGKLWIAHWEGSAVIRWDPETAKLLQKVSVPNVKQVTSCAFGGENLDVLYITTATEDMNEQQLEEQPLAGSLFRAEPGVRGVPLPKFAG
jgi:sugar lactone lactonase YvrE